MNHTQHNAPSTINSHEIEKFQHLSSIWWDKNGPVKPLHTLNHLRVPWIIDGIIKTGLISKEKADSPKPLQGLKILDVGCGAGILTEELAEYGCIIIGIDPCTEMIHEAKKHVALNASLTNINYFDETAEQHAENHSEQYDVVIASEVIDHVDEQDLFLDMCSRCLKPGGPIFVTTFNKTWTSWLVAIIFYEYVWGVIPRGGHSWYKFISPNDVQKSLEKYNCQTKGVRGMLYNFLTFSWLWCSTQLVSYALYAVKDKK